MKESRRATESAYGHIDGPEADNIKESLLADPFECLLGICRVLGLHYDVRNHNGRWAAKLSSSTWPGDFFGGAGTQTRKRSFTTCNCDTRLDALRGAFVMAFMGLEHNCDMWRGIVADLPHFKPWFEEGERRRAAAS